MHKNNWLDVLNKYITTSEGLPLLSEYELYGNYVLKYKRNKVNKIINPIDYKMRIDFANYKKYSPEKFILKVKENNKNYYQCINLNNNFNFNYV
jgi:hypothetical protein